MNAKTNLEILPEDRVKLTKDQRNLITLALEKQLLPEDAEFLEAVKKNKLEIDNLYERIQKYYKKKYGSVFGEIYLSAIINGEDACVETINSIEKANALKRLNEEKNVT